MTASEVIRQLPCPKLISLLISGALVWKTVTAAIEFDCKLCDGAVEIQKVNAAGILAAKFEIVEAMVAQQTPQTLLGFRGVLPQSTGEVAGCGGARAMFAVLRCPP